MRRARAVLVIAAALGAPAAGCAQDREGDAGAGGWTVHAPGVADPGSPDFHGSFLRARAFRPMLDEDDPNACGRCHDGTLARPRGVTASAPGATDCRACHSAPQGVVACGTCHDAATSGAHAAHIAPSPAHAAPLACSTCHPTPDPSSGKGVIGGAHGDGVVEVVFDPARVAPEASYDRATGACAVACHDRGGARARPRWTETGPMRCGDCHASPPEEHAQNGWRTCSACHREANADGTALAPGALHANGRVDLGDGSGGCGACHGRGDDPWPATGAHRSHEDPSLTTPIACATCHVVPSDVRAPGHLDGVAGVALSGRAADRGAIPRWDGASCGETACHGARLVDPPAVVPSWYDASKRASACGACHGIPPSQHTTSTSCDRSTCHGEEVSRTSLAPTISPAGRALHVNGAVDTAP